MNKKILKILIVVTIIVIAFFYYNNIRTFELVPKNYKLLKIDINDEKIENQIVIDKLLDLFSKQNTKLRFLESMPYPLKDENYDNKLDGYHYNIHCVLISDEKPVQWTSWTLLIKEKDFETFINDIENDRMYRIMNTENEKNLLKKLNEILD